MAQNYPVSGIPEDMKLNAHMVVREYNDNVEVIASNKANETVKKVFTVLDNQGESDASLIIHYDKNTTVDIKQIIIYDGAGAKIKSVKEKEVKDYAAFSSYELFSESRVKYYEPVQAAYPYTIVYEYNLGLSNVISYGCWSPYDDYNISSQHSQLTVIHPSAVVLNAKEFSLKKKTSENRNGIMTEIWDVNNIPAIVPEPYGTSFRERIPCVYLMPEKLSYYKYEGNAKTWKDYGSWVYSLYENRSDLPESEKVKINDLLKEVKDTIGQIKTLYNYMQGSTRYVLVVLGAGGYQPFDAATVTTTGYGDCKALTNYMYSMLKYKGIKSYPALVASGTYKERIFKDFPNFQQFDHVILCVPFKKDTIWLECTDQKIPFGFLGDFTDNRDVLLITETGGIFSHTAIYRADDNLRTCRTKIDINPDGSAGCSVLTSFHGLQYDNLTEFVSMNYEEQKKWLLSNSTLPSVQMVSFSTKLMKNKLPVLIINESLKLKNYCSYSGQNIILPLNLINAQKPVARMLRTRFSDVVISHSFTDIDTIEFNIPDNMNIESVPSGKKLDSSFGSYSFTVSADKHKILYSRRITINEGRYEPKEYPNLYNFLLAVSKADEMKVLLSVKK
jgi:transglutaminase-like putative cysteine protease